MVVDEFAAVVGMDAEDREGEPLNWTQHRQITFTRGRPNLNKTKMPRTPKRAPNHESTTPTQAGILT